MRIEVSNGEIVDKFTILLIKQQYITDEKQLSNIKKELESLAPIADSIISRDSVEFKQLYEVNKFLWEVEDNIRVKESKREFDDEFIDLARHVYYTNDQRAAIKRTINELSRSYLVEEKSYEKYR